MSNLPIIAGLVIFGLFALILLLRPRAAAQLFQQQAKNDSLSFNRTLADPANLHRQTVTFRLVGALGLLLVGTIALLFWVNQ